LCINILFFLWITHIKCVYLQLQESRRKHSFEPIQALRMSPEKKLKRTGELLAVLLKYGFGDIAARMNLERFSLRRSDEKKAEHSAHNLYERIRMALEELGPAYVKFGQMFSTRDDLLPAPLIAELQLLQDQVRADHWDLPAMLQKELGIDTAEVFSELDTEPLAAASMSQVYKARLKENGKQVVLKIKRPGIEDVIAADLLIMKDLVSVLEKYSESARSMGVRQMLDVFETAIHNELSLFYELAGIERFARNFRNSTQVYVPVVYRQYSNNNVLCMEFIEGIKISDCDTLRSNGIDPQHIARQGLTAYMEQVLEYGYFHADPHPGNIFVLRDGRLVFIDFGNMGSMMPPEKELLEDFVAFFALGDIARMIRTLKKISVRFHVHDEKQLERKIYEIREMISSSNLQNIGWSSMFLKLKTVFRENDIELPAFAYSLMRGLVLIEGIGQILSPGLNIQESIHPYALRIIRKRSSPAYLLAKSGEKMRTVYETLADLPDNIRRIVDKISRDEMKINHEINGLAETREMLSKSIDRLGLAIIIASLSIGSALIVRADLPPKLFNMPLLSILGFVISAFLALVIVISMLRKKK